jgi:SAM-dependent methyltransferase
MFESPEKEYSDPNIFYTKQEANRYNNNKGMKRSQRLLTKIALDVSKVNINKKTKVLDIGCGTGFSLEYFLEIGANLKNILGIDVSKEMLKIAKSKKFNVYEIGFLNLEKLLPKKFDVIISISALQWMLTNKQEMEIKNQLKKIAKNINVLLKENGVFVMQFYPPTKEIIDVVISCFQKQKFIVEEYQYNKESSKKRKYFLVFTKK